MTSASEEDEIFIILVKNICLFIKHFGMKPTPFKQGTHFKGCFDYYSDTTALIWRTWKAASQIPSNPPFFKGHRSTVKAVYINIGMKRHKVSPDSKDLDQVLSLTFIELLLFFHSVRSRSGGLSESSQSVKLELQTMSEVIAAVEGSRFGVISGLLLLVLMISLTAYNRGNKSTLPGEL